MAITVSKAPVYSCFLSCPQVVRNASLKWVHLIKMKCCCCWPIIMSHILSFIFMFYSPCGPADKTLVISTHFQWGVQLTRCLLWFWDINYKTTDTTWARTAALKWSMRYIATAGTDLVCTLTFTSIEPKITPCRCAQALTIHYTLKIGFFLPIEVLFWCNVVQFWPNYRTPCKVGWFPFL